MKKKKILCTLLACSLLLSLTACGSEKPAREKPTNVQNSNSSESQQNADPSPFENKAEVSENPSIEDHDAPASPENTISSLEDTEVRLVYADGSFVSVAFHGPEGDIHGFFTKKDGSSFGTDVSSGNETLRSGWTRVVTYDLPVEYTVDDLSLTVMDYSGEKTAEGTYPSVLITDFGAPMTESELKSVGFDFLDGRCCIVAPGITTYGGDCFGLYFAVAWYCDDYELELDQIDGFAEKVSFYTEDGVPLEEYFEGYTLEIELRSSWILAMFYQNESGNNKAKNESMCSELRGCNPYMVYTNDDGSTQQFPFQ